MPESKKTARAFTNIVIGPAFALAGLAPSQRALREDWWRKSHSLARKPERPALEFFGHNCPAFVSRFCILHHQGLTQIACG